LLQPERQTQQFFLRHQDELQQNYLKSAVPVHQLAFISNRQNFLVSELHKIKKMESNQDFMEAILFLFQAQSTDQ
jgi:hypothetical protein